MQFLDDREMVDGLPHVAAGLGRVLGKQFVKHRREITARLHAHYGLPADERRSFTFGSLAVLG